MNKNEKYLPEGYRLGTPENRAYISSLAGLERAVMTGAVCEASAFMCDSNDYSLKVDLGGAVGIIKREEALLSNDGEIKNIAVLTRVGRAVAFTVQYIDKSTTPPTAYLSRKEAQRICMREYVSGLVPGDIIEAKVTHIERFGAFVDIGCGIIALLPVDSISVSRISHPKERLSLFERIYVIVKGIDGHGRISVSQKELYGTWLENAREFTAGQTVAGIVRSIEDYGVFVELAPNLTGLAEPHCDVWTDEGAAVYIKSISPSRMKIKLAIVGAYKGEILRDSTQGKYFVDVSKVKHIDRWRYSPDECDRVIETVF